MPYAIVNKPMLYQGENVQPGDVVDIEGVTIHALVETGHLLRLPDDPNILDLLAQKIRDRQAEDEEKKRKAEEDANKTDRERLEDRAKELGIKFTPNTKDETLSRKIAQIEGSEDDADGESGDEAPDDASDEDAPEDGETVDDDDEAVPPPESVGASTSE